MAFFDATSNTPIETGEIKYIRGTGMERSTANTCRQLTKLDQETAEYLKNRRLNGELPKYLKKKKLNNL